MTEAQSRQQPSLATAPVKRSVTTCRWAAPTLFLPAPYWFAAEGCPWTCLRDAPRPLEDAADACTTCSRWEPRTADS